MKKIFAVLDSKDVYGKELSNIEVCKTLEEHGYDITILYNKDASERLKQEINLGVFLFFFLGIFMVHGEE